MAAQGFGAFTAAVEPAVRRGLEELHRLIRSLQTTFTAELRALQTTFTAERIRLTATGDASLSSTAHAFQIGPDTGANLIIDNNEIIGRNNGSTSSLALQADGGTLVLGGGAGQTLVNTTGVALMPAGDNLASAATVSNQSGWSTTISQLRQIGPLVFMQGSTTRTGAAIAMTNATGNISNQTICTITSNAFNTIASLSNVAQPLHSGNTGRLAHFTFNPTTGVLSLVAVAPGADIATNEQWSWGGLIMVHVR